MANFGMDTADMKKLLIVSKRQPVHCGVGMTKDGVVLLMDKIKTPRLLVKDLEKQLPDMKSPHWGTAVVDTDVDPRLVILTLNKAAPGMARRMKKTLKGTGFTKVEIRLEDGSVADKAGEDEDEGADGAAAAAPAASAAPAQPAAGAVPVNIAALGEAKIAWSGTRKKVEDGLQKLHGAMADSYKDHGFGAQLDQAFQAKVEPMLRTFDDSLEQRLDAMARNTDPQEHTRLMAEARQLVQRYEAYLASEPLIARLDNNPFVPLDVAKSLTATLADLSQTIA
jgi:hypothetical protein